ncbi:Protein of unknown function [Marinobacter daqiaonensis]|uniref:DUF2855 domain-containing protein n=1 Tax=Marinobacter daqiaonensis TaxID=650891 RepID=A0A1I6IAP4_9GAMM|nr:DUF2855 family protein [Marinobacter daqiaonensis]SFR63865.1 Protein of unknown function [Marinobacter daqiaonensis]
MTDIQRLLTNRRDLGHTHITPQADQPLEQGQILLRIRRLAVTTNNITYAAFGDTPHLRYWDFYPTGEAAWGQMPAWGFADVMFSDVEGVEEGERFYGFWPVATHVVMEPVRVTERGFYDGTPHRQELTSAYNQYQRITTDAAYRAEDENYQMLLRPLFITSFMLADFLEDNRFFGARRILVSSASSKTAYGTVFCLQKRDDLEVVGLTSAGNRAFVEGLGAYDAVEGYDSVEELDPSVPTLYVDFSGNAGLRSRIHHHLKETLVHDCYAGSAHSHDHISTQGEELPGPEPRTYFAPNQIRKRNTDWGPAEVTRRFNEAQLAFIKHVKGPDNPWIEITEHRGLPGAQMLIRNLVDGKVEPREGHVVIPG